MRLHSKLLLLVLDGIWKVIGKVVTRWQSEGQSPRKRHNPLVFKASFSSPNFQWCNEPKQQHQERTTRRLSSNNRGLPSSTFTFDCKVERSQGMNQPVLQQPSSGSSPCLSCWEVFPPVLNEFVLEKFASARYRTTSNRPSWVAATKGVCPLSVRPLSWLAPDSTKTRATSMWDIATAMYRGVVPISVVPWSLLAPDSTSNRTISMCPLWAAVCRGVAPVRVKPWSLFAPDSTKIRTTSRCPFWDARYKGVAPVSLRPSSFCAPASSSRRTHSRLPLVAAACKGMIPWRSSSKFGFRGWFKSFSSSLSPFAQHANMISQSCWASQGRNSRTTSCTTSSAKVSSSLTWQLSWRSRSRNRGKPIFWANRCFNALTEASANSSSSKTAIDSPVTAESTSSMGLREGPQ